MHIHARTGILTVDSRPCRRSTRGLSYRSDRKSDRRLRAAGLPNGTRNYPDADRRIMRGYQARAHVGRGSLCVVLFTDWGCDGRRVSSLPRIPAQQRPPCLGSLPPGRVSRFQDVVSTGMISISSSTRPSVNGGRVVRPLVGQITPDERIDRSGPPGLAPVCQEIAARQSPRLLPQHCGIGQAVAAQRHRRRQVRHDLPRDRGPPAAPSLPTT
jgi:hypothetical protein